MEVFIFLGVVMILWVGSFVVVRGCDVLIGGGDELVGAGGSPAVVADRDSFRLGDCSILSEIVILAARIERQ